MITPHVCTWATGLRCVACGADFALKQHYTCSECGGILEVTYDYQRANRSDRWQSLLLPVDPVRRVTLGEGHTALLDAPRLAKMAGLSRLLLKCEFTNPTGSFKDRPISIGITKALELDRDTVIVASTGNAAASVAAYTARAALRAVVLVPDRTSAGKVAQTLFYGATVVQTRGTYSDCYAVALSLAQRYGFVNLSTTFLNPYTVEGNKEIAFEIQTSLATTTGSASDECAPEEIFIPVGAGPMLVGIANGYRDLSRIGLCERPPAMVAVQAAGCSPIAAAWQSGAEEVLQEPNPQTIAGGIGDGLCGYEADGTHTLRTVRKTGGYAVAVTDGEILNAQRLLARTEGIFVEPTAAAGLAGVMRAAAVGTLRGKCVAVILSGHGLKDQVETGTPAAPVDAEPQAVLAAIEAMSG